MANIKIGVLVGSLRKDSYSKMMFRALKEVAPAKLELENVDISKLALYNQDFDDPAQTPAEYTTFRDELKKYEGFLFITPEYNRSVPAVLKNALDVGSRPYGESVWNGKPGAVISLSIGALGAFGANHHLRQTLVFLNVPTMPQPEAYIGNVTELFDESGSITDPSTRKYLAEVMESFSAWVELHKKV